MVPKTILMTAICATGIALSGFAAAQDYRPGEYLTLDLPRAVMSPKPIGPANTFKPGPLGVTFDRGDHAVQARAEPVAEPTKTETITVQKSVTPSPRVAHAPAEHLRQAKRTPIALHRRNPVEAEARDIRIQVWPCRTGGICNWKR